MFNWKWNLTELPPADDLKVFSCFSCGGGSTMGYKRAGFKVIGNVEIDAAINKIYVANFKPKYNYNLPQQRLDAIKNLADIGIHVTLRLRPYIIGVSGDWKDLILRAKQAGADSVTTEFFCMESRADDELKARYAQISDVCNFDIYQFYQQYSEQQGYKRLNRKIKAPIIYEMKDYAHSLGMRFHVSDMFCRECNDACNCCGVPPEWNASQMGHIGQAILIAKQNGFVRFSDIQDYVDKFFRKFKWGRAIGYNKQNSLKLALNYYTTMADFIRNNWNDIKRGTSPAKGYGDILIPYDVDENGDVIYKYNGR